ncbi:MAG: Peptidoglycan O-acetyltransferase [candidate division BRC1 bacterium ADurb.BinA364]|nr:MAG: Peptidoglycan O-acetyltransferase [candidate division BRC1 bacterium ADurb.BinA364]
MLFNSWIFWVFLPCVLGGYFLLPRRGQNAWLLAASYVFYGWWDWRFLGLILLSTSIDYFAGLGLDWRCDEGADSPRRLGPGRRRTLLLLSLGANLGVLGFFKYFHFFEENLIQLLSALVGRPVSPSGLNVILPIGVSFYTFQTMSYTIDVYRGKLRSTRDPLEFATFVAFFPQLVAGPIVRASDLLPQIAANRRFDFAQVSSGAYLILWGMFKKAVVADNLAPVVDGVFARDPSLLFGADTLWAVYAFAFQIYCDFSGYTDIARGCAKLMGFEFDLNFNLPYSARNPSEFWARWHISLSSWLRDYLYIPLGGNRCAPGRVYFNLMATMLLGGLWHGASWTFVVWGLYQGLLLIAYRFAGARLEAVPALARLGRWRAVRFLRWLAFFHLVCLGWLIFRAETFGQMYRMLRSLAEGMQFAAAGDLAWRTLFFASPVIAMQIVQHWTGRLEWPLRLPAPARGAVYAALLAGIVLFGRFQGNEFIYFQF